MRTEILNRLKKEAEEQYRIFSARLLPKGTKLLGVRIPHIRKLAKELLKEGRGESYLQLNPSTLHYQEELMLYGLIIANLKLPQKNKLALIKKFVPYINSWAVCDIFCADLKDIKKDPAFYYRLFLPYTQSKAEYQIRFFYVAALGYFITENLLPQLFGVLEKQTYVGFYDKMAAAWFISVAYVKFQKQTEDFIKTAPLDKFVLKKSISKINDSLRVDKAAKARLKTLAAQKINLDI